MATGSVSVSITIPVLNVTDPNMSGRQIAVQCLEQVAEAIGQNSQTSGNVVYGQTAGAQTVVGTWSFTPGT